jgi:hypothetical protein
MKAHLSDTDRKTLMGAGFPRQTIYKWVHKGIIPRSGNRAYIAGLLGRDPWGKKKKNGKAV